MSVVTPKAGPADDCACDSPLDVERPGFIRSIDPGVRLLVSALFCLVVISLDRLAAVSLALGLAALTVAAARQKFGT